MLYGQIVVAATPTELAPEGGAGGEAIIANRGAASVYLGDVNVTDVDGFELKATDPPQRIFLKPDDALYAVTASGTQRVDILQA